MTSVEPEMIGIGQLQIRYVFDGTVNGAASGMFELIVPPGARVPPPQPGSSVPGSPG